MKDLELDPFTWFCERELKFKPVHFILTKTPVTAESKKWIYDNLKGRFSIVTVETIHTAYDMGGSYDLGSVINGFPAFEDPAEAMFYELTWS